MPSSPLLEYLKEDRQWPRRHRIAHAQHKRALCAAADMKLHVKFFNDVLKANGARKS